MKVGRENRGRLAPSVRGRPTDVEQGEEEWVSGARCHTVKVSSSSYASPVALSKLYHRATFVSDPEGDSLPLRDEANAGRRTTTWFEAETDRVTCASRAQEVCGRSGVDEQERGGNIRAVPGATGVKVSSSPYASQEGSTSKPYPSATVVSNPRGFVISRCSDDRGTWIVRSFGGRYKPVAKKVRP